MRAVGQLDVHVLHRPFRPLVEEDGAARFPVFPHEDIEVLFHDLGPAAAPLDGGVLPALGREHVGVVERPRVGVPLFHHRAVIRIPAAVGIVMKILLVTIVEARDAAHGHDEGGGDIDHLVRRAERLEAGHVVVLVKGHQLAGVAIHPVLVEHLLDQRETRVGVFADGIPNGLAHGEVEYRHARVVGEIDRDRDWPGDCGSTRQR